MAVITRGVQAKQGAIFRRGQAEAKGVCCVVWAGARKFRHAFFLETPVPPMSRTHQTHPRLVIYHVLGNIPCHVIQPKRVRRKLGTGWRERPEFLVYQPTDSMSLEPANRYSPASDAAKVHSLHG